MNRKRPWTLAAIVVSSAVLIPAGLLELTISAGTQEEHAEVFVLEGLKGISLEVVQPVSAFDDKPRFNPVKVDDLHSTAERLLTELGIEVSDNPSGDPQIGHVVVTINVWKGKLSINFVVQVKVELYQQATLVRDAAVQILTPTWPLGEKSMETGVPLIVTHHEIGRTVRHEIETQVKMLINDYLEANPVAEPKPDISGMMTGTIRGGVILADNGVQYDPVNLPHDFRRDGLRIAFRAKRTRRKGPHIALWLGPVIEITKIIKL